MASKRNHDLYKKLKQEPKWEGLTREEADAHVGAAFNFYRNQFDPDDSKQFFIEFIEQRMKMKPEEVDLVRRMKPQEIGVPWGWVARMISAGAKFTPEFIGKFQKAIKEVLEKGRYFATLVAEKESTKTADVRNGAAIQRKIDKAVSAMIGELETEVDKFFENYSSDFNAQEWISKKNLKGVYASRIAAWFQRTLDEIEEIKTDEQLKEAYKCMNRKQLKAYTEFLENIVGSCAMRKAVMKSSRPKKVRKKSPEALVSKMRHSIGNKDFKVTSIQPAKIIGASQLWVFNTKYRTLGVYIAKDDSGLSVKRSSIVNFDDTTSITKKVRKPAEVLPLVLESGKVALRKVMNDIKCKEKVLTGRINAETVLLRVIA